MEQNRPPPRAGELFYHEIQTSQGVLELLAEIVIDGSTLHRRDIAVYPRDVNRLALGAREMIGVTRQLGLEAKRFGFETLRITGVRYSGARPGKDVDIRLDLTKL